MSSPNAQLSSTVSRTRLDTSWPGLQRLELTSTSNLLPPLSLAPLPAPSMLIFSMPLTSLTTSSLPVLAHERATSPLFQASAFAFRSFPLLLRPPLAFAPSSNKRHHHHQYRINKTTHLLPFSPRATPALNQSADETRTPASRCLPSTCPCRFSNLRQILRRPQPVAQVVPLGLVHLMLAERTFSPGPAGSLPGLLQRRPPGTRPPNRKGNRAKMQRGSFCRQHVA